MSRRFSLVLSEIGSAAPPQRPRNNGPFHSLVLPVTAVGSEYRNGGAITRRGTPPHTIDLEACARCDGTTANGVVQHQHHVVELDVPTLPKRAGLRNCLLCTACLWTWIAAVVIFAVASWQSDLSQALRASRHVAPPPQTMFSPRMASENNHCTFSVFATVGTPSRLQLIVALASTLAPSVDEGDIRLRQLSPAYFEIDVACCTRELYQTLKNTQSIDSWNAKLTSHYDASVVVSRILRVQHPPNNSNTSALEGHGPW